MEIGTYICVFKTMEVKTIEEIEVVNDEKIFYMTDSTSYHEREISDDPSFLKEAFLIKMKKEKAVLETTLRKLALGW